MTSNAVNNPKVRYELGEGGGPEEAQNRIQALVDDYGKSREVCRDLGFNADLFDLEPKEVVAVALPEDEEAQIHKILNSGGMNKAGTLFNLGTIVVSSKVLLEAHQQKKVRLKEALVVKEKAQLAVINEKLKVACTQFNLWNAAGSRVDAESGYPIMTSKCALSIDKVLLPKIDPTAKLSDYTTMKVCTKWLGELAGGTTWTVEMTAIAIEDNWLTLAVVGGQEGIA